LGVFHCPMGAPFHDGPGCILCGLCLAATQEEMVEATRKVRAYLRSQPERTGRMKKIAVCGKGGTGKSTIVSLMAEVLKYKGLGVLAIDTDESNPGLFRTLGLNQPPKPLLSLLSRFAPGEQPDDAWMKKDELSIQDIPPQYIIEDAGLRFIQVGKIEEPLQGCACSMADITHDLVEKLRPGSNEVIIIDTEAGIESFGRGVERSVDTVLIITEPSFESMALAEKITYMADGIGVRMVRAILNKVPSEEIRRKMVENLALRNVSQVGTIHLDDKIAQAGLEGKPVGDSPAKQEMSEIIERLLKYAK
jgi:CO dehydrogenase maturation factor